jgi:hypothetical protein
MRSSMIATSRLGIRSREHGRGPGAGSTLFARSPRNRPRAHESRRRLGGTDYRRATMRSAIVLLGALHLSTAPYQCKGDDPERAREDTPGDALWTLCERFTAKGDVDSARATLDFLMDRYPSSRLATRAHDERAKDRPCTAASAPSASASH